MALGLLLELLREVQIVKSGSAVESVHFFAEVFRHLERTLVHGVLIHWVLVGR